MAKNKAQVILPTTSLQRFKNFLCLDLLEFHKRFLDFLGYDVESSPGALVPSSVNNGFSFVDQVATSASSLVAAFVSVFVSSWSYGNIPLFFSSSSCRRKCSPHVHRIHQVHRQCQHLTMSRYPHPHPHPHLRL